MPWTHQQKMDASEAELITQRDRYISTNPEYISCQEHLNYRANGKTFADNFKAAMINGGLGQNPPGNPPTPPGS